MMGIITTPLCVAQQPIKGLHSNIIKQLWFNSDFNFRNLGNINIFGKYYLGYNGNP